MADTPKRVIRLIDNIKLELYEGRKKYVQIWEPIGNNTYNEGDDGLSGIKSPEKSKNFQSAEDDNNVIHFAIRNSQIVEYYRLKAKRTNQGKEEDIKPYFTYLQDPFSETPPPKRIYGGGGLGTPEVDNVGPTPYYLNNGCKINIKWTGKVPNPDFKLGTFSTPDEAEDYNQSLDPEGPPRWLFNQPILSDIDETDSKENSTLRPQSEWILETYYNPGNSVTPGVTYSNYRDKPYVNDKFVTITLPTGFTENGGKGYLEYIGSGYGWGKSLVYSTEPKGDPTSNGKIPSVLDNFNDYYEDKNILESVITGYKMCVSEVYKIADFTDYPLKVCFPDTGTCSPIPYKSPIVDSSGVVITPSVDVVGSTPSLVPKKVKLNVFGLPGVTSLSGETDGNIKVKVKVSLPDFTVYLGDPPGSTVSDATGLNPFGLVDDEVENPDPYEESNFSGIEESEIESPSKITEVPNSASYVTDPSSTSTYTPDPNAKPGTVITLPRDYSHTSEQGYNIINSQWIGDLITSAKSHIGHPTFDITGTENGNLGCASAVSMIFYRAFGVGMKDGKAVKPKPTDIGSFGTKGTSEAAGWFKNASLYQKINWKDAQPGDIMNTARNFKTEKAGHIGVVVDVKDKNGSWAIISNSSKGFAGGGGGAVKQNYSVKAWQSVTDRNPSETFAFRYIGPRLSPGKTA
jgi:hypothetical protein